MEKRLRDVTSIVIIGILMIIGNPFVYAQSQPKSQNTITSDTNAVKKEKQKTAGFFERLFHRTIKNVSNKIVNKNSKKSDTAKNKQKNQLEPIELTKGNVTWTNLYTKGINLNTGISGIYSMGRLSQGFNAYGIPLTGDATGVFNNGQFERSYSSYAINFDAQTYMQGLKKRAENILLNKKALEQSSGKMANLSDSLNVYESVRKKLTSPSYQSEENISRTQFAKAQDSAKKNPGADTAQLHTLRNKIAYYDQMKKRYGQLYEIKKNYSKLAAADTADKSIERKFTGDEKSLNNPDNVAKILDENHQLSGFEKSLMGFQKFSVGQSGEEISEFTLYNFMMNGLNVGYKTGDVYSSVGYGKQIAVVDPTLLTGITVPDYNRTVEFFRFGIGAENKSNVYATVIRISDPGNSQMLGENNWVLDLTKKIVISKNFDIEGEIAKSSLSYFPNNPDNTTQPNPQNGSDIAFSLRAKGTISATNTILKTEYSQTGYAYTTLGNPYLISGADMYRAEISQPIGSKFFVTLGGDHIIEKPPGETGTTQTDNWIDFSLRFKPTRLITMELKYSPRQLQQQEGTVVANSTTNNINQISFIGNLTNRLFNKDANTSIFIGNFQFISQQSSLLLSQNTNLSYYMMSEMLMFTPTNGINISADESRNNWTGGLSQFIGQGMYTMNVRKSLTLGVGPQWIEQPGIMPNGGGLIGSINKNIQKLGKIGIELNYRNSIDKPFGGGAQWLVSGNVSILW